jgi:putative hemolysin
MKRLIITSIVLFAGISGGAMAACDVKSRVTGSALITLISNQTVCATRGGDKWQEQHRSGGQLWDYKKGPSDQVDPSEQVGTWSIASNNVTYTYTGGSSFTYSVHNDGGAYSFCTAPSGAVVVSGATFTSSPSCP